MSKALDTYFLPIGGRFRRRGFDIEVLAASNIEGQGEPVASKVKIKIIRHKIWTGPDTIDPTKEQFEQVVGVGELIRYGNLGLHVRNIVPPDTPNRLTGWVEVQQKEVSVKD